MFTKVPSLVIASLVVLSTGFLVGIFLARLMSGVDVMFLGLAFWAAASLGRVFWTVRSIGMTPFGKDSGFVLAMASLDTDFLVATSRDVWSLGGTSLGVVPLGSTLPGTVGLVCSVETCLSGASFGKEPSNITSLGVATGVAFFSAVLLGGDSLEMKFVDGRGLVDTSSPILVEVPVTDELLDLRLVMSSGVTLLERVLIALAGGATGRVIFKSDVLVVTIGKATC